MTYDVIVLGSGPAGFYFAKSAAAYGKKVLIVEKELLGGTGFRTGCLPVKKYMDGLRDMRAVEKANASSWCQSTVDKEKLYETLNQSLKEVEVLMTEQLTKLSVDIVYGDPEIKDNHTLVMGAVTYTCEHLVVATGTATNTILGCEIDEEAILSHKGLVALKELPKSLTIIGGNVEGIEFASYLSGFGVDVTVIAMGDILLEGTDRDLCEETLAFIADNGGRFMMNTVVTTIEKTSEGVKVTTDQGETLISDKLLITGARSGNIPNGLSKLDVEIENTCLKVDENYQTSLDGIYAIGDVNGLHGMAHIAIQQGLQLADYLYDGKMPSRNYDSLPRAIFTINEIAGAGLQACNCEELNIAYKIKEVALKDTFRAWSKNLKAGKVKLILDTSDKIIGAWMSGENASDYMGTVGLWIDDDMTKEKLKNSLFIHPSIGEGLLDSIIK